MTIINYTLRLFRNEDSESLKNILLDVGWAEHYVQVHSNIANDLLKDQDGEVFVAESDGRIIGFIAMKHQKLNFLTFVPTLVVSSQFHRQGLGKALLKFAEERARQVNNRGIYLDTTENNHPARAFYKAVGFHEAYMMPHFYLDDVNGVTYLKLFNRAL